MDYNIYGTDYNWYGSGVWCTNPGPEPVIKRDNVCPICECLLWRVTIHKCYIDKVALCRLCENKFIKNTQNLVKKGDDILKIIDNCFYGVCPECIKENYQYEI